MVDTIQEQINFLTKEMEYNRKPHDVFSGTYSELELEYRMGVADGIEQSIKSLKYILEQAEIHNIELSS